MVFYVYFQPELIREALSDGEDAIQLILGILKDLHENCYMLVFEDYRWQTSIKEFLDEWPNTMTKKRIQTLLQKFKNDKRYIYTLLPDYSSNKPDIEVVYDQALAKDIDVIIVEADNVDRYQSSDFLVTRRSHYYSTNFEYGRNEIAVNGKTLLNEELEENQFLRIYFRKVFKYSSEIVFCDRICGKSSLTDNYKYSLKHLFDLIEKELNNPNELRKIIFHIGNPGGSGYRYVIDEIRSLRKGRISTVPIEVNFYDESPSTPSANLPHQRFIKTDQIVLDIDRGLDFLNITTKKCRDTRINYQSINDAEAILQRCKQGITITKII
jgi:hypothetical protein